MCKDIFKKEQSESDCSSINKVANPFVNPKVVGNSETSANDRPNSDAKATGDTSSSEKLFTPRSRVDVCPACLLPWFVNGKFAACKNCIYRIPPKPIQKSETEAGEY